MSSIDEIASRLRSNSLFHFSLGSKELFHSNFLSWLCNNHPREIISIFAKRMPLQPTLPERCTVVPEEDHHDLTFHFDDGQTLIVENKVKSMPSESQLQRYSDDLKNKQAYSFILLSLVKSDFENIRDGIIRLPTGATWAVMDYEELANELTVIHPKVERQDSYHGRLLSEYIAFITFLNDIAEKARIDHNNFFAFKEFTTSLEDLRIDDLVYKRIFSEMSQFVSDKFRDHFPKEKIKTSGNAVDGMAGDVFVTSAFSRATGMFTVDYVLLPVDNPKGPCVISIQVQDNTFKIMTYTRDPLHSEIFATALAEKGIWFNFDKIEPYEKKNKQKKIFNGYTNRTYIYRYRVIGDISPEQLADITVAYIREAGRAAGQFREIFNNTALRIHK